MDIFIQPGITLILWIQSLGAWLASSMSMISFLGNEEFYLFVAPAIFWCIDAKLGLRLGISLMVSSIINSGFKLALRGPRPYWVDVNVNALSAETSFGVPSGHSQNAAVVWGTIAKKIDQKWAWAAAVLLTGLIGLSRMYLGVHFPHDVLFGWLLGAIILWSITIWEPRFLAWFNRYSLANQVIIAFLASMLLIFFVSLIRFLIGDYQIPQFWILAAAQANPDGDPIAPLALSGMISNAGTLFGLAVGGLWLHHQGWMDARGKLWKRLLRFLIGVIGVFILWFGLGEIFPRGEALLPYFLRYLRYALVGLWISGIAPWLFMRMKIAEALPEKTLES
jgi:membrane-associated phospholipid phosphatase